LTYPSHSLHRFVGIVAELIFEAKTGAVESPQHRRELWYNEIYDELDELPAPPRVDILATDCRYCSRRALRVEVVDGEGFVNLHFADGSVVHSWNSLKFSGDVLDLAVRLRLEIYIHKQDTSAMTADLKLANEPHGDDAGAAARRAITRVAGEIEN
jgi:hypothetical protein